jgi:hypothetical protein
VGGENYFEDFCGGEFEGKTQFGRPRRRWEAIKVDFKEIGLVGVDWIDLAQDRDLKNC